MTKAAIHRLNGGMLRHSLYPDLVCTKMLLCRCKGLWEREIFRSASFYNAQHLEHNVQAQATPRSSLIKYRTSLFFRKQSREMCSHSAEPGHTRAFL